MATGDIILKFEIAPGRSPDATLAADAISAWVELLRSAAAVVEPTHAVRIELVGVEDGSQVFKFAVRKVERFIVDTKEGMKEFPEVSKVVISLGALVVTTAVGVGLSTLLAPDPKIPDEQMKVFEDIRSELRESVDLQREQMRFYGILQDEPAYDSIDVISGSNQEVLYSIPRADFAARSGLWTSEPMPTAALTEKRTAVWDVVLIKPVLKPEPRRWRFAREGLEFSALMQDADVLRAIHDRTFPLRIAEGVMMKVEVTYREASVGSAWIPVSGSYKIKRVLSPLPSMPVPLLAADIPEEQD